MIEFFLGVIIVFVGGSILIGFAALILVGMMKFFDDTPADPRRTSTSPISDVPMKKLY